MTQALHKYARVQHDESCKPPAIKVQYFHSSSAVIDDPLAPCPFPSAQPQTPSDASYRPFSPCDNIAIEKAWVKFQTGIRNLGKGMRASFWPSIPVDRDIGRQKGELEQFGVPTEMSRSGDKDSYRPPQPHADPEHLDKSSSAPKDKFQDSDRDTNILHRGESFGLAERSLQNSGLAKMPFARVPSVSKAHADACFRGAPLRGIMDNDSPVRKANVDDPDDRIPVGALRLYQVGVPGLDLEPIYWSPVKDTSSVIRGTWFYKSTMLPVEPDIANLLEKGYTELRPWTDTWNDQLNSAVEVGAIGEMRIVYQLWGDERRARSRGHANTSFSSSTAEANSVENRGPDMIKESLDSIEAVASEGDVDVDRRSAAGSHFYQTSGKNLYLGSSVIYANEHEAFILRPKLQPSSYYGRRPLANYIRRNRSIGICVVRGFDRALWDRLNPIKPNNKRIKAPGDKTSDQVRQLIDASIDRNSGFPYCPVPQVTDLVLVIHGIGQKLSERRESFHFTHAMNNFRREVHMELTDPTVKASLRDSMGSIMVLPVNWRSTLSFNEGGYQDEDNATEANTFSLKDITPQTLSSVRGIISDVMLDIPYYLSHHQPKMIDAVIREANRVYRLWCTNNPGFEEKGNVHLIAHSLGSVMAMDILSKQPTSVDAPAHDANNESTQHFNFDTKNLYMAGSPAGFFLLMRRAGLVPRRNQSKPSVDGDELFTGATGDQGEYGCLAVKNIYNIVNGYDPVATLLNAAVDSSYAASLKPAFLPSASSNWFPFGGKSTAGLAVQESKRGFSVRLPSNVELETHNFTREEIAEKRAYLLNDNGQIDYFMRDDSSPLALQYITMLGAHSSYWLSKDFVRFIVAETGRPDGRFGTIQAMRAVKKNSFTS